MFQADEKSRLCAFFSCTTGLTSRRDGPQGCDDGSPATADAGATSKITAHLDEGMLGCCRVGSGTLTVGSLATT